MAYVKGLDFPTGGLIMGRQGILDAYRTGKGSIRIRALAEIEESTSGRQGDKIVVTEMPYQSSISATAARIAELVQTRQVEGIADVNEIGRHTSELQSLMRISYAVFCLKKKKTIEKKTHH